MCAPVQTLSCFNHPRCIAELAWRERPEGDWQPKKEAKLCQYTAAARVIAAFVTAVAKRTTAARKRFQTPQTQHTEAAPSNTQQDAAAAIIIANSATEATRSLKRHPAATTLRTNMAEFDADAFADSLPVGPAAAAFPCRSTTTTPELPLLAESVDEMDPAMVEALMQLRDGGEPPSEPVWKSTSRLEKYAWTAGRPQPSGRAVASTNCAVVEYSIEVQTQAEAQTFYTAASTKIRMFYREAAAPASDGLALCVAARSEKTTKRTRRRRSSAPSTRTARVLARLEELRRVRQGLQSRVSHRPKQREKKPTASRRR